MSDEQHAEYLQRCYDAGLDEKQIQMLTDYLEGQTVDETCEKMKALVFDEESDGESDLESDLESDEESE